MPRNARLDVADVLQHVMAREIDRYDIFQDKPDREAFLLRAHEQVGESFSAIARADQRRQEALR